jgi:hypothetical protein
VEPGHGEGGVEIGRRLVVLRCLRAIPLVLEAEGQEVVSSRVELIHVQDSHASLLGSGNVASVRENYREEDLSIGILARARREVAQELQSILEPLFVQEVQDDAQVPSPIRSPRGPVARLRS